MREISRKFAAEIVAAKSVKTKCGAGKSPNNRQHSRRNLAREKLTITIDSGRERISPAKN
ncbi:MAG: hypothetical protein LBO72_05265 [Helicobacteraceae bacterium]|jgi:hypothetical protein|nr:hypothetical protein [Helicobacteraceae bacterium]